MDSDDKMIVFICALIACVVIGVGWIIANGLHQSSLEDTKRINNCVESGGSWTDITPNDNYADMGCVQK